MRVERWLVGTILAAGLAPGCQASNRFGSGDTSGGSGGEAGEAGTGGQSGGSGGSAAGGNETGNGNGGTVGVDVGGSGMGGSGTGGAGGGGSGGGGATGCVPDCSSAETCLGGKCLAHECSPAQKFCSGNSVRQCAENGLSSEASEECEDNQYCDTRTAECKTGVCAPNQPACDGNRATTCNAMGSGYVDEGTGCAETTTCDAGTCEPQVCIPNVAFCQANDVKRCADNGLSSMLEETCSDRTCIESGDTATCTSEPPSCQGLPSNCGSEVESCCTSLPVTGGSFNRSNDSDAPAKVSDFRLDKFEVTVGRFRRFVDAVVAGWRPSAGSGKHVHLNGGNGLTNVASSNTYSAGWDDYWSLHLHAAKATWDGTDALSCHADHTWTPSAAGNETRPITCVNWYQAHAFCIWDGGFLPSETEWDYAATGGSEQRTYPWGPATPGANADLAVYGCYYGGTGTCTGVANIAPVGSVPAGDGAFGQADLAGNVWEWTLDRYADYITPCNDCVVLTTSVPNTINRGGGWSGDATNLPNSDRDYVLPDDRSRSRGFRCARAP